MSDVKIHVKNHGPLRIEGSVTLVDAEGRAFGLGGRTAISLCRCGGSENKPFCDGAHAKAGFVSACEARELLPAPSKA
jgi:CDGSH-type Zn-finger protein